MGQPFRVETLQELDGQLMTARHLLRVALSCFLAVGSLMANAQPSPPISLQRQLLLAGKYGELEQLYKSLPEQGRTQEGELPSVPFFHQMQAYPVDWPLENRVTRGWLAYKPRSVPAVIGRAYALSRRARELEDAGDWAKGEPLIQEGLRVLSSVRREGAADITWHVLHLSLGEKQGWTPAQVKPAVEAGMAVDPTSMYFYSVALRALAPDPRGSAAPIAWLAHRAAEITAPSQGQAMYTRIYMEIRSRNWAVATDPFGRGMIEWKLMQQGLIDLYEDEPSFGWLNHHAALACLAGDKPATAAVLQRLGRNITPSLWKEWGGDALYERCKSWVLQGTAPS